MKLFTSSSISLSLFLAGTAYALTNGENVVLKHKDGHFEDCTVTRVSTNGNIVLDCDSDTYSGQFDSFQFVSRIPELEGLEVEDEVTLKEGPASYVKYWVTEIYDDGSICLVDVAESYNCLAVGALKAKQVTKQSKTTILFKSGAEESLLEVTRESRIILKHGEGDYRTTDLSAIYGDGKVACFDHTTEETTYRTKEEISKMWVMELEASGTLESGGSCAIKTSSDPASLERDDLAIEAIYSDGVAQLSSFITNQTYYRLATEVQPLAIGIVDELAGFKAGGFYVVEGSSESNMIYVPTLYADGVIRYIPITEAEDPWVPYETSILAPVESLQIVKTFCDPAEGRQKCAEKWRDHALMRPDFDKKGH